MKYFVNHPYTAESLKNEFRALSLKLHPDTGGNAQDFAEMLNEYQQTARDLNGTREHAKAQQEADEFAETIRRAAERMRQEQAEREAERKREQEAERRRREEERRAEEERKAKARPLYEKRCKKWAGMMEDLTPYREAVKKAREAESAAGTAHGWRSDEYKQAKQATKRAETAETAARRRNLLKMAQTAFKGVKFGLKYDNGWGGGYTVSWQDGPSVAEFEAATDYDLFVSGWDTFDGMTDCAGYGHADFTDFAHKYNGLSGKVEFSRTLSEANRRKLEDVIIRFCPDLGKNDDPETRERYHLDQWDEIKNSISYDQLADLFRIFGADFDALSDHEKSAFNWTSYSLRQWADKLADYFTFKTEQEKRSEQGPQFRPRYGEALRTLHRLTGVDLDTPADGKEAVTFWQRGKVRGQAVRLSILEAVAAMERGEAVLFGSFIDKSDGDAWGWGQHCGGYKVQRGRAEKFAAAGYTLKGAGYMSPMSFVTIDGVTAETAAAIRQELADIDRQREAWQTEQAAPKSSTQTGKKQAKGEQQADTTTTDNEAPADGLELQDIAGGVAVVGSSHATFKNRKAIKAHGATWNREANRWEATDPDDVARLRAWFALREQDEPTATANDEQADTLEQADEITDTTDEPQAAQSEPTADTPTADTEADTADESEPEAEGPDRARFVVEILTRDEQIARPYWSNDGAAAADWKAAKVEEMKNNPDRFELLTVKQGSVIYYDIEADKYRLIFVWNSDNAASLYTLRRIRERWQLLFNTERKHRAQRAQQQAQQAETITDTASEPTATAQDEPQADTLEQAPEIAALLESVADFFATLARIAKEAARWEGVTVPAATLERWKQEANEGTKTAAARLCEVCACLASLTPDSRRDFDALGGIFWTLSEQIRNGYNPDTLQGATDYARAQLFDLIERTQTKNQADRLREVLDPDSDHRAAA
jgi:hypothetical protein